PDLLGVRGRPTPGTPLANALRPGAPLGLLGIQPHTRRRNRLNGHVVALDDGGFRVRGDQSFGNCPKYIQPREPVLDDGMIPGAARSMTTLDAQAQTLVRGADTYFIATAHPQATTSTTPEHGIDVSHRGGKPGFVRVDDGRVLTVPDFTGNSFFNTLGN